MNSRRDAAVVEDRHRASLLTALMLFPVYWMINVSLTRDQDMRKSPPDLFPSHPTLEGYRAVARPAAALPRHQPRHRPGHRRR